MVIIAIVATLATIYKPVYKNRIIKKHITPLVPIVDRIVQQTINYAYDHGRFPNPNEIELTLHNTIEAKGNDKTNPSKINTYLLRLWMADASNAEVPCGQAGVISGDLNGSLLGLKTGSIVGFACFLAHKSDGMDVNCSYSYTPSAIGYKGIKHASAIAPEHVTSATAHATDFFAGSLCM